MKILSPMSEQDEAEMRSQRLLEEEEEEEEDNQVAKKPVIGSSRWTRKVESAMTKMSAEVAALREQISTGREWISKKERSWPSWFGWLAWAVMKHLMIDFVILAIVLLWMRRRKDKRLEDLVRATLRLVREYVKKILPER